VEISFSRKLGSINPLDVLIEFKNYGFPYSIHWKRFKVVDKSGYSTCESDVVVK
jgi:hypothetical protein